MLSEHVVSTALSQHRASTLGRNPAVRRLGRFHFDDPGAKPGATDDKGGEGKGDDDKGDTDGDDEDDATKEQDGDSEDVKRLKAALKKQRSDARTATRRTRELEREKQEADAEKQRQADADAERQGEFEKLAKERKDALDTVNTKVTELTDRTGKLTAAVEAMVKDGWTAIPDPIKKLYSGAEDDVLAKLEFIAKSKDAVEAAKKEKQRGNGGNPPAGGGGGGNADAEAARKANASRYN